jgi:hypothetical protein
MQAKSFIRGGRLAQALGVHWRVEEAGLSVSGC